MRRQLLLGTVAGIFGLLFSTAWVELGDYFPSASYTPNHGKKWGEVVRSGARYLHVDTNQVWWDPDRVYYLRISGYDSRIVFHIFQQNSNCGVRMNFTGYWWSDLPGTWMDLAKWADCVAGTTGPNNEMRIGIPRSNIEAYQDYDFGGEWVDQGGGSLSGEADYDTYHGAKKYWMTKFFFEGNDSLHN